MGLNVLGLPLRLDYQGLAKAFCSKVIIAFKFFFFVIVVSTITKDLPLVSNQKMECCLYKVGCRRASQLGGSLLGILPRV